MKHKDSPSDPSSKFASWEREEDRLAEQVLSHYEEYSTGVKQRPANHDGPKFREEKPRARISGTLDEYPVAYLLGRLFDHEATGTLQVQLNGALRTLALEHGHLAFARSTAPDENLDSFLLTHAKFSTSAHKRFGELLLTQSADVPLAVMIVDENLMSQRDLERWLGRLYAIIAQACFAESQREDPGQCWFYDHYEHSQDMRLNMPLTEVVLNGLRMTSNLAPLNQLLPDVQQRLMLSAKGHPSQWGFPLTPAEKFVLSRIEQQARVADLIYDQTQDGVDNLRALHAFLALRAVVPAPIPGRPPAEKRYIAEGDLDQLEQLLAERGRRGSRRESGPNVGRGGSSGRIETPGNGIPRSSTGRIRLPAAKYVSVQEVQALEANSLAAVPAARLIEPIPRKFYTGLTCFLKGHHAVGLVWRKGKLLLAAGTRHEDQLGTRLLNKGVLHQMMLRQPGLEVLREAIKKEQEFRATKATVGTLKVALRLQTQVLNVLRGLAILPWTAIEVQLGTRVKEVLTELASWDNGQFETSTGDLVPHFLTPLEMQVDEALLPTLMRLGKESPQGPYLHYLAQPGRVPVLSPFAQERLDRLNLSVAQRLALEQIDGMRTVAAIQKASAGVEVAGLIFALAVLDIVGYTGG